MMWSSNPKNSIFLQLVLWIWTSLAWQWWFGFRLEPMAGNYQAIARIVAQVKSGQE